MDCRVRAGLECQAALIQAEIDLLGVSIDEHELASQFFLPEYLYPFHPSRDRLNTFVNR